MGRFILYASIGTVLAAGLMYLMATSGGLDPLAPEVRMIAWLSLLAAVYVGIRLAMVVRSYERKRDAKQDNPADTFDEPPAESAPRRNAFSRWGRDSRLDARLNERRERVRRARSEGKLSDEAD